MKRPLVLITTLLVLLIIASAPVLLYTQTMSDYCSAPPYATRGAPPNITVLLDNSANMLDSAYTQEYEPSLPGNFIGYFKTDRTYCASNSDFYEAVSSSCSGSDKGPYPGSLLNWAAMSKYDIVMFVLIGGKGTPTPSSGDRLKGENTTWPAKTTSAYPGCTFTITNQGGLKIASNGSCSLQTITSPGGTPIIVSVNDYVSNMSPRGLFQNLVDKNRDGNWDTNAPRISIMRFQASNDDIKMDYCAGVGGPLSSFIDEIASDQAKPDKNNSNAPLGAAILRTMQYYRNSCGATCNPCGDPLDNTVQCRKNFVLTVSGGEATDIPSPYTESNLYEQIRLAHTTDIRADVNGSQVINFYTVHTFGGPAGRNILQGFSRYGGFVDSNSNMMPDMGSEWDKNNDGIPDTYYEAANALTIRSALEKAFQYLLARNASGTAVSAMTTSSKGVGSLVQAHFLPVLKQGSREVTWTGYLQNLWLDPDNNLREDTNKDYRLILSDDNVIKLYFSSAGNETMAAAFTTDANGNSGTLETCSPQIKRLSEVNNLWDAGKNLAMRSPSQRTIFTSRKVIRGNATTHVFTEAPYPEFTTSIISSNGALRDALNPDTTYSADNIVRYIRGECLETGVIGDTNCGSSASSIFRDRRVDLRGGAASGNVWKLGDIANSTPKVFADTPLSTYHTDYSDRTYYDYIEDDSYRKKSSVSFVGANDGMLHAFRVGYLKDKGLPAKIKALFKSFFNSGENDTGRLGEEIWAYIPFNVLPYLKYLADPAYCHIYFTDLSVRLVDASIGGAPGGTRTANVWRTVLLGGMRFGGASSGADANPVSPAGSTGFSSYFAIDVTDPESPVPLWEFSDIDMGYATTYPSIIRTGGKDRNGNWYAVLGSGSKTLPRSSIDISRNTTGHIYILDLGTAELVKKIALDHNAIVGDILAIDADGDYHSERIYFGTAYSSSGWKGKFMSIRIPNQDLSLWSPSASDIITLFDGNYPFTASPDAVKDTSGNVWAYIGSGKYYGDLDEMDESRQIFLGMKDGGTTVAEGSLIDVTNVTRTGSVRETAKVCAYDSSSNNFGLKDIVTAVDSPSSADAVDTGWKIYLANGERVLSRPLAVGGIVDFLTYKPDADICKFGGESFLYAVGYTTGVAPSAVAILSPEAASGVSGNVTIYRRVRLGPGAPPTGDAIIVPPPKEGEALLKKKIQVATGAVVEAENQPAFSISSKIIHWLKK
jgi:type IV pilus assembly protein PilY1